jgi:hypothetical protein
MVNFDYDAVKQVLFNAVAGGVLSLVVGSLGTHIVRYLQGQSFHSIEASHPLITCVKVVVLTLPLWYLYKRYAEKHTHAALRPSAFELIFFTTALGVLNFTKDKVSPLLSLALILTHLTCKIFASTRDGAVFLGLNPNAYINVKG